MGEIAKYFGVHPGRHEVVNGGSRLLGACKLHRLPSRVRSKDSAPIAVQLLGAVREEQRDSANDREQHHNDKEALREPGASRNQLDRARAVFVDEFNTLKR